MFQLFALPVIIIIVGILGKIIFFTNKDFEPKDSLQTKINKNITIFYIIASTSILVDYYTKVWVEKALVGKKISILGDYLFLKLTYNPGAAFSFLSGNAWIFTLFAFGICVFILYLLPKMQSKPWNIALAFLFGGSVGNLIDRLFNEPGIGVGHVIDFIGYGNWFIGNIADIFIVLSILAIILFEIFELKFTPKNIE